MPPIDAGEPHDLDAATRYRMDADCSLLPLIPLHNGRSTHASRFTALVGDGAPGRTASGTREHQRAQAFMRPGAAPLRQPRDVLPADASAVSTALWRVVSKRPGRRRREPAARGVSGARYHARR